MKLLPNPMTMIHGSRPTIHGSVLTGAFKVCTHFKNVYALHFTYRAHTFCIYINDLGTCVQCVRT